MNATELKSCLFCGSDNLTTYLSLGKQPPANSYTNKRNQEQEVFPLDVNLCTDCGHSQLSVIVDPEILYSNYLFVSGTTKSSEKHYIEFAEECTTKYDIGYVLDIGCNDGSCLKQFKACGWDVTGVDPAKNLLPLSEANGIEVLCDFWGHGISKKLAPKKFDLIYGINVFAHNKSPYTFLHECMRVMDDKGTIVIEVPYAFNMLNIVDIGQVYHEHISYISVLPMMRLCSRLELRIADIKEFDTYGGSIRFYIQRGYKHCQAAINLSSKELSIGISQPSSYSKFSKLVTENISELYHTVVQYDKVIGYGAAAKASTIINASTPRLPLDYIVDDNPLKVGKYMPSTDIKILPTSKLSEEKEDLAIWITANNFQKEIMEKIKLHRAGRNDVIISYTPEVKVDPL